MEARMRITLRGRPGNVLEALERRFRAVRRLGGVQRQLAAAACSGGVCTVAMCTVADGAWVMR